MTNIDLSLRRALDEWFYIYRPRIVRSDKSIDGTIKFLLELADKNTIETVFIPETKRNTICVSSQVGCAIGCRFCNTGYHGFIRNLLPEEIVSQFLIVKDYLDLWHSQTRPPPKPPQSDLLLGDTEHRSGVYSNVHEHSSTGSTKEETDCGRLVRGSTERLSNIVFMGMGEPLLNHKNVLKSIDLLMSGEKDGISRRKITLSTSGIADILKNIAKDLPCRLAVSLHAPNDSIRSKIMPINNVHNIKSILGACEEYKKYHEYLKITFEYLLLDGINDSKECAQELLRLLSNQTCKVNLIQFNSWQGSQFKASSRNKTLEFARILEDGGIEAPIRARRGEDIMAACGQLK
jgi:23S rRNA (adenine2503-C2)-methyltransferase